MSELEFELQIFDEDTGTRVREDWTNEHLIDEADMAETYVLLDGCDVQLRIQPCCGFVQCRCDDPEPFSQREYRDMYARHFAGPTRYRP